MTSERMIEKIAEVTKEYDGAKEKILLLEGHFSVLDMATINEALEEARKVGYDEGRLYGQEEGKLGQSLKTYELGEKAGRREVVEWGNEECLHLLPPLLHYTNRRQKRYCNECWQAKLKDWGNKG